MKSFRRVPGEGLLKEIVNPLQNSNSLQAGIISCVGKTATKDPSQQSQNSLKGITSSGRENVPPSDLNVHVSAPVVPSPVETIQKCNPEKESAVSVSSDVQIAVRIRPLNVHEKTGGSAVKKVSSDSLCIGDKTFRFDSVFDFDSTQQDIFNQVGASLVKDSLAGFNTSLLLYGQTGSGKTYTIWGPQSAIISDSAANSLHCGIAPRFFEMLFSEIQKEKENCVDRQLNYQCRCSFLEIYNEQIADLLDPTKRHLQIKEDVKNGVYVENLTEECAMSMDDVNYLLIKGLSNRRIGATTVNSKSSRSHIILTCLIESWCKESSSTCFSSSKCSRINLIDLAGSEKQKKFDAGCQFMMEYRNVKKSLSQLGNVVNTVADATESKKARTIPYRCSPLTCMLQDSIGGNTKLTVLCTVSPAQRFCSDTLSTLRFGQRARAIQNKATVNEITEDDVSNLSDQIRQLKEELIREKSKPNGSIGDSCKHLRAWNTRESLNRLRLSLNYSMSLSQVDGIHGKEKITDEDLAQLCTQLHILCSSFEENAYDMVCSSDQAGNESSVSKKGCTTLKSVESERDLVKLKTQSPCLVQCATSQVKDDCIHGQEDDSSSKDWCYSTEGSVEATGVHNLSEPQNKGDAKNAEKETLHESFHISGSSTHLQINPSKPTFILQDPTESTSPRIEDRTRKGLTSQSLSSNKHFFAETLISNPEVPQLLRSSKKLSPATEYLAASLQRGTQIINNHQQHLFTRKSLSFSFRDLSPKPFEEANRVDAEVKTSSKSTLTRSPISFKCMSCNKVNKVIMKPQKCVEVEDATSSLLVPINTTEIETSESQEINVKVLDRGTLLGDASSDQADTIKQLNLLYEQECAQHLQLINIQKDKILFLEGLVDANLLSNEASEVRRCPLTDECQSLEDKYDSHPGVIKVNSEIDNLKMELDCKYKTCDLSERKALLQEIEDLKSQLQLYRESIKISQKERPPLLQSTQLRKSIFGDSMTDASSSTNNEELELDRKRWLEIESEWISLTEGLRVDLEAKRSLAERKELELNLEKECSNELNDALQRAIQGHARIVEQYADLQDNYTTLLSRHRIIMEGIENVKSAAAKAGKRGAGPIVVESLAAELSTLRYEKDKERDHLKKENRRLRIQLRDTAEAVQAAGELLVRLKEAEAAAINAEARCENVRQEAERMKQKMDKLEKKHMKELALLKTHLANSRLPECALEPLFQQQSNQAMGSSSFHGGYGNWREEFTPYHHETGGTFSTTSNQMQSQSHTTNVFWDKWNQSHIQS